MILQESDLMRLTDFSRCLFLLTLRVQSQFLLQRTKLVFALSPRASKRAHERHEAIDEPTGLSALVSLTLLGNRFHARRQCAESLM